MTDALIVRPLTHADAPTLSSMLRAQPFDYMRYFIPFAFDELSISERLRAAQQDLYIGMFWGDALAGFFMLRGWDEGYAVPAYGVTIDHRYRNYGLGRLSLEMAKTICRLRGAERLMLKVHPENTAARQLYERAGFQKTGVDPRNENWIYHFDFSPPGSTV